MIETLEMDDIKKRACPIYKRAHIYEVTETMVDYKEPAQVQTREVLSAEEGIKHKHQLLSMKL